MSATWEELLERAAELGYEVELVEYCESLDSPGILGAALGVCIYAKRVIRLREGLDLDGRRLLLEHELEHAANGPGREANALIDAAWHREHDSELEAVSDRIYARPIQ